MALCSSHLRLRDSANSTSACASKARRRGVEDQPYLIRTQTRVVGTLGEVLQDILYRYFAQLNISLYKQMFSDFFHQEIYDTDAGNLDI